MNCAQSFKRFEQFFVFSPMVFCSMLGVLMLIMGCGIKAAIVLMVSGIIIGGMNEMLYRHYIVDQLNVYAEESALSQVEGGSKRDILKIILDSFDQLQFQCHTVQKNVNTTVTEVLTMEDDFRQSFEKIASGSENLLTLTGHVVNSVGEISSSVNDIAKNTSEVAQYAENVSAEADKGRVRVDENTEEMKALAGMMKESTTRIHNLGKRSEEIGGIIHVIDGIAEQTNLLALNAAIEAARAGDVGRGFAVVADEVRKLAERTTKSTKEIGGMIGSIQADIKDVIKTMDSMEKDMVRGKDTADKAGDALKGISSMVSTISGKIQEIASASVQQSQSIEAVSGDMQNILKEARSVAIVSETSSQVSADFMDKLKSVNDAIDEMQMTIGKKNQVQKGGENYGTPELLGV